MKDLKDLHALIRKREREKRKSKIKNIVYEDGTQKKNNNKNNLTILAPRFARLAAFINWVFIYLYIHSLMRNYGFLYGINFYNINNRVIINS